jgi:putative photosynthetic complex assembly protein 2
MTESAASAAFAVSGLPAFFPILFATFVWWSSTGIILFLDGLPRATFRWSMAAATLLLAVALQGLADSAQQTSVFAAYQAFLCAVLVWAWLEMSFLLGFLIGPRRSLSHPPSHGFKRFAHASEAIAYHELALVSAAIVVAALTWDSPNPVGAWTFAILWVMRLSAKLNLFLGVPNLSAELLPAHLAHLRQYLTRRPMNLLFPISVSASSVVATLLVHAALDAPPDSFDATGLALVSSLLCLAILEHWFMVVPVNGAKLWQWALDSARRARGERRRSGSPIAPADSAGAGGTGNSPLPDRRMLERRVVANTQEAIAPQGVAEAGTVGASVAEAVVESRPR